MIIIADGNKYKRFYIKNLLTNKLERCSEKEFNEIIAKHRECFELQWDGNAQNYLCDGVIEARRER